MLLLHSRSRPQALEAHSRQLLQLLVERIDFYTEGLQRRYPEQRDLTLSTYVSPFLGYLLYEASGTACERRMTWSRVSNGTLWTTLVAAMISSAGSLLKSRRVEARATTRSIGYTCTRFRDADYIVVVEVHIHTAKLNELG